MLEITYELGAPAPWIIKEDGKGVDRAVDQLLSDPGISS